MSENTTRDVVMRSATGREDRIIATRFSVRANVPIEVSGQSATLELAGISTGLNFRGAGLRVRSLSHALDRTFLMAAADGRNITVDFGIEPLCDVKGVIRRVAPSFDPSMDCFFAVEFDGLNQECETTIENLLQKDLIERRENVDSDLCASILSAYGYFGCFFCEIDGCMVRQQNRDTFRKLHAERIPDLNRSGDFLARCIEPAAEMVAKDATNRLGFTEVEGACATETATELASAGARESR